MNYNYLPNFRVVQSLTRCMNHTHVFLMPEVFRTTVKASTTHIFLVSRNDTALIDRHSLMLQESREKFLMNIMPSIPQLNFSVLLSSFKRILPRFGVKLGPTTSSEPKLTSGWPDPHVSDREEINRK